MRDEVRAIDPQQMRDDDVRIDASDRGRRFLEGGFEREHQAVSAKFASCSAWCSAESALVISSRSPSITCSIL
jgi:hypothetical protein